MTVCAVGVGVEFHARREVKMVRSALLYADRVRLASPNVEPENDGTAPERGF